MGSDNKTCKPLNLFFSYGHEKKDQFITCKIFHAVKDRGHHVWRDTEKITFSSSWRQKIENGVLHSNGVIGCLSAYSCRPGGVCLDELSIAVGVRGGRRVYSILLDKEGDVNPPQSVADRQWLDMSDWREKRAQGSDVFEPWFAARMQELFAVVESPENVEFVGQITTIRQRLAVYYGTARQNKLLQNPFIGRAWLTQRVDAWLDDENAPRTLFLTGAPAVGKSAWACHYAQYNGRVAAALFLDSDCDYFNDPRTVIQTLAFLLACRLPEYREILMEFLPDSRKETARMNEQELFSCLLAEPFQHIVDGAHRHMAIVIDGLDEAGHETNALAKVLFRYAAQLPDWIRFLLCGRDVPALKPFTETALRVELPSGSAENLADMRALFCFRLEKTFGSDPQWGEALERMTARSEGIALYAQLLCDMLLDKKTLDCEEFPKGLTGMFTVWFEHYIPDVEEFRRFFRPAICCILGAPGQALPIATLRRVMGWRAAQTNDFLLRLQVLLRRKNDVYGEETVTFDHAFVREWLGSEAAGKFYCPPEDGRELLAEGIYAAFEKEAIGLTCWEAAYLYAQSACYPSYIGEKVGWSQMLSAEQSQKVTDSFALEDKVMQVAEQDIQRGDLASADMFFVEILERADDRLNRHGRKLEILRRKAACLNKYACNLKEQYRDDEAKEVIWENRIVLRKIFSKTRTAEDKRNLLMNYVDIGDMEFEGIRFYKKAARGIKILTFGKDGMRYLLDLALCYAKIGEIQTDKRKSVFWYEKERAIYEGLDTPGIEKTLMDCYMRLGTSYEKVNEEKSKQMYQLACEKWEEFCKKEGTGLAIQFDRAGSLFSRTGNNEKALENYRESLKLREQQEKLRSTQKTRFELAVNYLQVASAFLETDKTEGIEEIEKNLYKAHSLLDQLSKEPNIGSFQVSFWLHVNLSDIVQLYKRMNNWEFVAFYMQKEFDNYNPAYAKDKEDKESVPTADNAFVMACGLEELGKVYEHTNKEIALAKYKEAMQLLERSLPYMKPIYLNMMDRITEILRPLEKDTKERIEKEKSSLRAKIAELEQKTE